MNKVSFGVTPSGEKACFDFSAPSHIALQGITRSGKSSAVYHLISSLIGSGENIRLNVIDPSYVMARPLMDHPLSSRLSLGLDNSSSPVEVVDYLLEVMRERIDKLWPARLDKITAWSDETPLEFLIVEELPGLIDFLSDDDAIKGRKPGERLKPRFIAGLRQLLMQGLKVGVVVILIAQRFDASLITGSARANIGTRISLRVEDNDSITMLFPFSPPEVMEEMRAIPPGRGLILRPGREETKIRLFHLNYRDYLINLGAV